MAADTRKPPAKRINTSRKGRAVELMAAKMNQAVGAKLMRTLRSSRRRNGGQWFSQANDYFGCIDLVVKKPNARSLWIQVTSDTAVGIKASELEAVPWTTQHDDVQIWRYVEASPDKPAYFHVYRRDNDYAFEPDSRLVIPPEAK